jgi:hypothetical protein
LNHRPGLAIKKTWQFRMRLRMKAMVDLRIVAAYTENTVLTVMHQNDTLWFWKQ